MSEAAPLNTPANDGGQDSNALYTRSDRFFKRGSHWFYTTREGDDMGPFGDKAEAQMALVYFIERTQWPDDKQLRAYIRARKSA